MGDGLYDFLHQKRHPELLHTKADIQKDDIDTLHSLAQLRGIQLSPFKLRDSRFKLQRRGLQLPVIFLPKPLIQLISVRQLYLVLSWLW